MSTLFVSEYAELGSSRNRQQGLPVAPEPALAEQAISFTGTPGLSAAFNASTRFIRVHTTGICSILVGSAPTATTSHKRLAADQTEYFAVTPGDKISAITNT